MVTDEHVPTIRLYPCVCINIIQTNVVLISDVNECEMIPELCLNGTCQNTYGGFQCQGRIKGA